MAPQNISYIYALLSALCVGAAWLYPSGALCAALGWLGIGLFVLMLHSSKRPYLSAYLSGIVTNCLGFYWLTGTISEFGGFGIPAALLIFAGFVLFSALQYLICVFLYLHLPASLDRFALRAAASWSASEFLSVRIFPWQIGHTQIAFAPLAQIAELGGSLLVSFMLCWAAEAFVGFVFLRTRGRGLLWAPVFFGAALVYGTLALNNTMMFEGPKQKVALVQANLTTAEKHNVKYFEQNTERYTALTAEALRAGGNLLVIWPETVLQEWIATDVGHVGHDQRLPYFGQNAALLLGTLTFDGKRHRYNSAMVILPDGRVPPPYHKRILMPFGEYMPFASWFPWIQNLNPGATGFSSGTKATVFEIPLRDRLATFKMSPLICYEDMVQGLAREAVREGAEILVNLTNDAWFGRSAAPYQHHLIASFRAIENRRYLLRSTNSGLTAVVDATGKTIAAIPPFSEQVLFAEAQALKGRTIYNRIGNAPWWVFGILCLGAALAGLARGKHTR